MNLSRLFAPAVLSIATVALAAASPHRSASVSETESGLVRRVRSHLDSVLTELSARDLGALTATQRARRAALVETLHAYRDAGVFPHNYDFPGRAVPYFVDRKTGTLCAVGYLLASTGRGDIVDRVAHANNNIRVAQLAGDSAFGAWLATNGLTLAEAGRIQVLYAQQVSTTQVASLGAFLIAAPLSLSAAAWNATGNSDGHRRFATVLGMTSGIIAIGAGTNLMSNSAMVPPSVGIASAAIGGLSVALAARSIYNRHSIAEAKRADEGRRPIADATITPMLATTNGGSAGVAVSIRF